MNIAVACGLIILVLLVIMLLAGVPIAVALAVSSICDFAGSQYGSGGTYGSTAYLFRNLSVQPSRHSVLYPGGKYHEQRRNRDPSH